jgi:hypothetical protein
VADWDFIRSTICDNYEHEVLSPRALQVTFSTTPGRSQMVWITYAEDANGGQWAQIDSPIGTLDQVDLPRALSLVENVVCGGLCHVSVRGIDLVTIRHCVPLENLAPNEFSGPLEILLMAADSFEEQLTGHDVL